MLYLSLLLSLIVVVGARRAARPYPEPIRWGEFFLYGAGAVVAPMVIVLGTSPVVFGVLVALTVALAAWWLVRRRLRTFVPLLLVAAAVPYGIFGLNAFKEHSTRSQLQNAYPLESLVSRAPEPRADLRVPLPLRTVASVDRFETNMDPAAGMMRGYHLRELHERSIEAFVNSPGFGVGRMRPYRITADSLKENSERDPTPAQPGSPALWGSESFTPLVERDALVTLHTDGVLDFVNPRGWGYVQSRDRVAGFVPHRFSRVPEARTYAVQRVELVGLLKHPDPVVYLSDHLPAMADLPNVPTRAPDAFETAGLERVRKGDDGFAARRGDAVQFVGGIRSARQCLQCHGGERGDLLGAFSYTLRPKP